MTTSQKKDTDNYILVRDERGYWDEAGNDIERSYRINTGYFITSKISDYLVVMPLEKVLINLQRDGK